jgi:hypothetical protein
MLKLSECVRKYSLDVIFVLVFLLFRFDVYREVDV